MCCRGIPANPESRRKKKCYRERMECTRWKRVNRLDGGVLVQRCSEAAVS